MTNDATLLRRYAADRSEEAFSEFVQRHLPLVYSAALRRLGGDAHRAEDVAQGVFCAVARDAHRLSQHPALTGWLYTATRYAARDALRSEKRRRIREEESHIMHQTSSDPEIPADWSRLRPVLDTAMDGLNGHDREAVLLRFFEGRPFAEIGGVLGLSEDAARKRVDRALDKLRGLLRRHRIASTSTALAALLASETISAAPASLAASITGAALATGSATVGAITLLTATKLQLGLAAVVIAGRAVGLITQQRTISSLREDVVATEQQRARLASENDGLNRNDAIAQVELAKLRADLIALQSTPAATERPRGANNIPSAKTAPAVPLPPAAKPIDRAASDRQNREMHRRYDPFFAQRALTPAQGERFIELKLQIADANQDLQASVRQVGMNGDKPDVEKLRSKLTAPMIAELHAILGEAGYNEYRAFEGSSYFRASLQPLQAKFASANATLSSEQMDQMVKIVAANDHPRRINPTDISVETHIDWNAVIGQSNALLTPAQQAVLKEFAEQNNARAR